MHESLTVDRQLMAKIYNHTASLILAELLAQSPKKQKWFSLPLNHWAYLGMTTKDLRDGLEWLKSCDGEHPLVKTKCKINKNSMVTDYYLVNRKNVDRFVNRPWKTPKRAEDTQLETIKECLSPHQILELEGKR